MKVSKSFIQVVGTIWMPSTTAATQYNLTAYDIENIGEINRESVDLWLSTHSGDFSSVKDFRADIELPDGRNVVIEWEKEDNEFVFNDCMYSESDY